MDAVKFIKELRRMCDVCDVCVSCPAHDCECQSLENMVKDTRIVAIVEAWSAAHPAITRADMFKKAYPNAGTDPEGILVICPKHMDKNLTCPVGVNCWQCRQEYWTKEVQNGRY